MSSNIEKREKTMKGLNDFIANARMKILGLMSELKWDPASLNDEQEMDVCPFDDGHVIPKTSLHSHIEKCKLRKENYHPEDVLFPDSSAEPSSSCVLKIDSTLQASILKQEKQKNPAMLIGFPGMEDDRQVPQSSDRFMTLLTSDEKAALHSYVISHTTSPGDGKEISMADQDLEINFKNKNEAKREKTDLEKLIEERDAKRRKEGKKVHINRKTHTEIIREVIHNQMDLYVEWMKDEGLIKDNEERPVTPTVISEKDQTEVFDKDKIHSTIHSKDNPKSWESFGEKERHGDSRYSRDRKREVEYYQKDWKYEREKQRSRHYYSKESGSKRERDNDDFRYKKNDSRSSRDNDDGCSSRHRYDKSRNYREYAYDKYSSRYHHHEESNGAEKGNISKCHREKEYDYASDEGLSEETSKMNKNKRTIYDDRSLETKKREEGRHHKSKRHHQSSDSESEYKSKKKKKKDKDKRDD